MHTHSHIYIHSRTDVHPQKHQVTKLDTRTQMCTHSHTQSHLSRGDGQGRPLNPVHGCATQDEAARVICPRPHNYSFLSRQGGPRAGLWQANSVRSPRKGSNPVPGTYKTPIQPHSGISQSVCADALDVCVYHVCKHTYMIAHMIISIIT